MCSNHVDRLDPALKRPGTFPWSPQSSTDMSNTGRMDVWIEFKNATAPQVRTSLTKPLPIAKVASVSLQIHDLFTNFYPAAAGRLETKSTLADRFAEQIPADTFSVAAIQGFLMQYRSQPEEAVRRVGEWVRNGGRAE
jgi:chaperone BCS1